MPWQVEEHFRVVLGSNIFIDTPHLLVYEGESLFTIERQVDSGYLGVSFRIFDETGAKLATVLQNRLFLNENYQGDKPFAIEGGVHDWTLRETTTGTILCAIKMKEAANPAELNVSVDLFTPDGRVHVIATPEGLNLRGLMFLRNQFSNLTAGIVINADGSAAIGVGSH